jgi:hypothetical protein
MNGWATAHDGSADDRYVVARPAPTWTCLAEKGKMVGNTLVAGEADLPAKSTLSVPISTERFFSQIKKCRPIATRHDKLAGDYLAFIRLASMRLRIRACESKP